MGKKNVDQGSWTLTIDAHFGGRFLLLADLDSGR